MNSRRASSLGQRKAGRASRSIRGSGTKTVKPPMARASKIPAGAYTSRIMSVKEVKTASGAEAVEVVYELTDSTGTVHLMREVIPFDSWPFQIWADAMIAAGLEDGADPVDAVGVEERVTLEYPDPQGLGRLTNRSPLTAASSHKESDEDDVVAASEAGHDVDEGEFDDFADFDDDD